MDAEQQVRERAYFLWEKEGRPDGREAEFWERARLIEANGGSAPGHAATPDEQQIDAAAEQTFPASDPPALTGMVGPDRA
jgi:hypothetical protein